MPEEVICALELEDLNKGANCGNNMSGVKNVYISLKDNVAQFPKLPTNRTSYEHFAVLEGNIVMVNGQRFYHIYCSRDMGELKYTTQGTFGGKSMKANLEIYHPGFKPKLPGFIASVMNSEAIILARLNNGDIHMLGDEDRGAETFGEESRCTYHHMFNESSRFFLDYTFTNIPVFAYELAANWDRISDHHPQMIVL